MEQLIVKLSQTLVVLLVLYAYFTFVLELSNLLGRIGGAGIMGYGNAATVIVGKRLFDGKRRNNPRREWSNK